MCTFLTKRNLRGRKKVKDYKEGYSTFSPAELSNEMLDEVILYELFQNHNASNYKFNICLKQIIHRYFFYYFNFWDICSA
jgi:hypothetical protein